MMNEESHALEADYSSSICDKFIDVMKNDEDNDGGDAASLDYAGVHTAPSHNYFFTC